MMVLRRTLFCIFSLMQFVYAVLGKKKCTCLYALSETLDFYKAHH